MAVGVLRCGVRGALVPDVVIDEGADGACKGIPAVIRTRVLKGVDGEAAFDHSAVPPGGEAEAVINQEVRQCVATAKLPSDLAQGLPVLGFQRLSGRSGEPPVLRET
jgi:hypothetical protein